MLLITYFGEKMFQIIVRDESSLCLYGNEGGDYEEQSIVMRMSYEHDDCVDNCCECHRKGDCSDFSEKATIHSHFEDIWNGEEIFEQFLKEIQGESNE